MNSHRDHQIQNKFDARDHTWKSILLVHRLHLRAVPRDAAATTRLAHKRLVIEVRRGRGPSSSAKRQNYSRLKWNLWGRQAAAPTMEPDWPHLVLCDFGSKLQPHETAQCRTRCFALLARVTFVGLSRAFLWNGSRRGKDFQPANNSSASVSTFYYSRDVQVKICVFLDRSAFCCKINSVPGLVWKKLFYVFLWIAVSLFMQDEWANELQNNFWFFSFCYFFPGYLGY